MISERHILFSISRYWFSRSEGRLWLFLIGHSANGCRQTDLDFLDLDFPSVALVVLDRFVGSRRPIHRLGIFETIWFRLPDPLPKRVIFFLRRVKEQWIEWGEFQSNRVIRKLLRVQTYRIPQPDVRCENQNRTEGRRPLKIRYLPPCLFVRLSLCLYLSNSK